MGRQRCKILQKNPKKHNQRKKPQNITTTRSHKCPIMPVSEEIHTLEMITDLDSSALAYCPVIPASEICCNDPIYKLICLL